MPDIKCGELCMFQSTVDLVITVRDNNDEYPVFSVDLAGGFTFSVKEVSIFVWEDHSLAETISCNKISVLFMFLFDVFCAPLQIVIINFWCGTRVSRDIKYHDELCELYQQFCRIVSSCASVHGTSVLTTVPPFSEWPCQHRSCRNHICNWWRQGSQRQVWIFGLWLWCCEYIFTNTVPISAALELWLWCCEYLYTT